MSDPRDFHTSQTSYSKEDLQARLQPCMLSRMDPGGRVTLMRLQLRMKIIWAAAPKPKTASNATLTAAIDEGLSYGDRQ